MRQRSPLIACTHAQDPCAATSASQRHPHSHCAEEGQCHVQHPTQEYQHFVFCFSVIKVEAKEKYVKQNYVKLLKLKAKAKLSYSISLIFFLSIPAGPNPC